ncbi:MAG: hypothetical protein J3K34DRAFT_450426 [Monoraphidium minutum]|nr:MAG: hypothetical protein J3K34DRAFT_450426 [Monoraphidium minutum]
MPAPCSAAPRRPSPAAPARTAWSSAPPVMLSTRRAPKRAPHPTASAPASRFRPLSPPRWRAASPTSTATPAPAPSWWKAQSVTQGLSALPASAISLVKTSLLWIRATRRIGGMVRVAGMTPSARVWRTTTAGWSGIGLHGGAALWLGLQIEGYTPQGDHTVATTSQTPCTNCPAGTGGQYCTVCPANTYSLGDGRVCQSCLEGSTSPAGSTSAASCV